MLKLYGFPISNYYNMVRHTLILKEVPFEMVQAWPGAGSDYLSKSPMGKIPCIETEHGFLAETSVILDYIEAVYTERRLSPEDPWGQAKMKELIKVSELYIELQGRRLMPAVMRGVELDQTTRDDVAATMGKGVAALARLGRFSPYLMGPELTVADIVLRYSLSLAKSGAPLVDVDLERSIPGLAAWETLMGESQISRDIDAEVERELPAFMEAMQSAG